MDQSGHDSLTGIERLELELIVCDFVTVLNDGALMDLYPFMTESVRYKPAPDRSVCGRDAVVAMIAEIRNNFTDWRTSLLSVAVTDDTVLTEQELRLGLPGGPPRALMGFASFRFDGFRIASWHQVHC
jgi:hypothetical protein